MTMKTFKAKSNWLAARVELNWTTSATDVQISNLYITRDPKCSTASKLITVPGPAIDLSDLMMSRIELMLPSIGPGMRVFRYYPFAPGFYRIN